MTTVRRKLIEVALPLEAINRESAREKSIRHGHPSTLHLWWARRPLAACRAVLFASIVDDPSSHPEQFPTEEAQDRERQRLFRIIEELVKWENSNNERVLGAARAEIMKATNGNPPPVLDPFCGGGSIPLEAQRLGLEAHASDLNPVAVLITKALIEIPPKFAGKPPVNPESRHNLLEGRASSRPKRNGADGAAPSTWKGAAGLAADVRYYGKWIRDEAEKRIGHLYPKVKLPKEHGGGEATVIAWLWARTVKCPNPACGAQMPLVRSFWLSTKKGKQAWVEAVVDKGSPSTISFEVRTGDGAPLDGTVNRRGASCAACGLSVPFDHVRTEGQAGRMSAQLMAIVAEGNCGRVYVRPSPDHELVAKVRRQDGVAETDLPEKALSFRVQVYGMTKHRDLFTLRQLVALSTFSDLVSKASERVRHDAVAAGLPDDGIVLNDGGTGATAYADAVGTYLAFGLSKATSRNCTLAIWETGMDRLAGALGRQALPMTWDFAETNPLAGAGGDIAGTVGSVSEVLDKIAFGPAQSAEAVQRDAAQTAVKMPALICTDPPYYDNIGYADLSDFFYVWLRRSLRTVYPDLFGTLLVPKAQELIATPYRFAGSKDAARTFFETGLAKAFDGIRKSQQSDYPLTVYYAFKQSENDADDSESANGNGAIASTGWETMLEGLLRAGFAVTGTWPMRTELTGSLKKDVGALASSIVLVCRPRLESAPLTTRREFLNALKRELPEALRKLQHGNIAPVDLAQAAIGPGMAVFSRYSRVLEADGSPMAVRTALALINQTLDEVLAEQEGEFDADTRWALAWFEQHAMEEGPFGVAETLSKAKNTAVNGLVEAGILAAKAGKVRLLRRDEGDSSWDPSNDGRLTVWEVTQHLIHALQTEGEACAAALLRKVGALGEVARDLAYRLYGICERKKWAREGLAYNSLVIAWPEIVKLAGARREPETGRLL